MHAVPPRPLFRRRRPFVVAFHACPGCTAGTRASVPFMSAGEGGEWALLPRCWGTGAISRLISLNVLVSTLVSSYPGCGVSSPSRMGPWDVCGLGIGDSKEKNSGLSMAFPSKSPSTGGYGVSARCSALAPVDGVRNRQEGHRVREKERVFLGLQTVP
jgi:hypothetical protein